MRIVFGSIDYKTGYVANVDKRMKHAVNALMHEHLHNQHVHVVLHEHPV